MLDSNEPHVLPSSLNECQIAEALIETNRDRKAISSKPAEILRRFDRVSGHQQRLHISARHNCRACAPPSGIALVHSAGDVVTQKLIESLPSAFSGLPSNLLSGLESV